MLADFFFITFILATIFQLIFWALFFSKLSYYKNNNVKKSDLQPVSVIVCAKNEAENLKNNLPKVLEQDYPNFEVIVVDDGSTDNSQQILLDIKKKYPILHVINESNKELPGKKGALTKGILAAKNEILLLTDADCFPDNSYWLKSMISQYSEEKPIVLGFSPYVKENSLLNYFIRYETAYTATQYLSFAIAGMPYMGVGRNLAYKKALFIESKGFERHLNIASGDDDLFVNQIATKSNTQINIQKEALVYSIPKSSWRDYYYQKRRHLSTASSYQLKHQILLGVLAWSHLWHYLGGLILLLAYPEYLPIIGISYLVRIGVVKWMLWHIMRKLHDTSLWRWVILLDASYALYYFLFAPVLFITGSNTKSWT